MGYEDEFVIEIPAEFAQLQVEGEDEAVLVLAEHEAQVLVDAFEAVLEEGRKDVVVHHRIHRGHDVVYTPLQHFRPRSETEQLAALAVRRCQVAQRTLSEGNRQHCLLSRRVY